VSLAIDIDRVSKRFTIQSERARSLKERVVRRERRAGTDVPFWALQDVTLSVDQGETIGILGHNGSGKSTLLKLVGGIMKPTSGVIRTRGRVASLLELGAGFHPELTGRENIYLNGAILGVTRRDLDRRLDDIIEFAELEQFIDTQVRSYSSGMYVRLGFAVAINVDPDVLLVDEVLAVGDENFQRKCMERVHQLQRQGRTIVVVSHAVDELRRLCDRIAVLDRGHLVACDTPGEAIRVFREHMLDHQFERRAIEEARAEAAVAEEAGGTAELGDAAGPEDGAAAPVPLAHGRAQEARRNLKVRITGVDIDYPERESRRYLLPGEPLSIRVTFDASEPIDDAVFGLGVFDSRDGRPLYGINTQIAGADVPVLNGPGHVSFDIESVPLLDGTYQLTIGIHSVDEGTVYDWSEQRHFFEVMNPDRRAGVVAFPLTVKVSSGQP
jgi:ABC-type polysaccharide/polyol phosphate transport system ATPase subunit